MQILFYILVILLSIRVFFRLFGKSILNYFISKMMKRYEDDLVRQQNAHQKKYDSHSEEININKDLKIIVPEKKSKPKYNNVEDIDYEDVK